MSAVACTHLWWIAECWSRERSKRIDRRRKLPAAVIVAGVGPKETAAAAVRAGIQ